jgi:pectinesterase
MKRILNIYLLLFCSSVYAQYKTEIYVVPDGTGDFTTIQEAIDGTKSFPDTRITIYIKNGLYKEKVKVHMWNSRLTLKGESADGVIIRWDDYFSKIDRGRNSTFHTATLLVQGDDFRAENLTIENTAGPVGQALALSVEADRCVFENCRMLGNQDTLYADGANARQHYKNCYIEGTTDFIFGGATALFENCTIQSKANSYITAASTPQGRPYGFVFLNCKLTAADGVNKVYLGRPWRSYAKTVFVKCNMGDHIRPEGWNNWGSTEKERTVYYAEGGNTGPGAETTNRASWAKFLTDEEVKMYCPEEVLKPFLLPEMTISSKEAGNSTIPRDTSYTLQSAFEKYKKDYPFIRAIEYDSSKGNMRQADICYHSVNGRPLSLDIFSTADSSKSPKPAVVLIHGGGWSSGDKTLMHPLADFLAKIGYVAITVEYRLSPEAQYPAAVDDLKNAVTWIMKNGRDYNIDTNKIAISGCSAGAQLAGLVGLTYATDETKTLERNRIRAIINIDGVMDFTSEQARKYEDEPAREVTAAGRWFGGRYSEKPELWKEASPVYYVNENSPPTLFINSSQPRFHAGRDETIKKLDKYSIYSEIHTFDDAPHCFWLFYPWFEKTGMLIVQYLEKTLSN